MGVGKREGASRGRGHMYNYSWCMLLYGKNKKKFLKNFKNKAECFFSKYHIFKCLIFLANESTFFLVLANIQIPFKKKSYKHIQLPLLVIWKPDPVYLQRSLDQLEPNRTTKSTPSEPPESKMAIRSQPQGTRYPREELGMFVDKTNLGRGHSPVIYKLNSHRLAL